MSVTLVAIISISVLPRFFINTLFRQQIFLQKIINSLAYAQSLAIGSGCHVAVAATTNNLNFNLRQNCTTGAFNLSVFDPTNTNNILELTVPNNITIAAINFPIYFDNYGLSRSINTNSIIDAIINVNGNIISIIGNTGLITQ